MENANVRDYVAEFIATKKQIKELEEKLSALETVVLNDCRTDGRILIVAGRKTITIKPETYENLEMAGYQISITETRNKVLKEFDIEVQNLVLSNKENYEEKISKESIRIKEAK